MHYTEMGRIENTEGLSERCRDRFVSEIRQNAVPNLHIIATRRENLYSLDFATIWKKSFTNGVPGNKTFL